VDTGTRLYTVADLSRVWVRLDAYESDLAWVKYAQPVTFTTQAYPGEEFAGTVSFVDPLLDEMTRTVKVRVNVANDDGRLRPGMFVRATVRAKLADGGKLAEPDLAGKWISPMHPEVVKDGPGECDVCGMPLVKAETLGYVSGDDAVQAPLVIPSSAPLVTGRRAVVYVALPDEDGAYEGREVSLGPRAGDYYVVRGGLSEGELVVAEGAFKIDSAIQIRAGKSMMSPEGGVAGGVHHHGGHMGGESMARAMPVVDVPSAFRERFAIVVSAYLGVQVGLAADDLDAAVGSATKLGDALSVVDAGLLRGHAGHEWAAVADDLREAASAVGGATDIEAARRHFALLSEAMYSALGRFGPPERPLRRVHCPMVFDDRGADWLQAATEVENPYFGSAMLRCGEIVETLGGPIGGGEAAR
jgi:Cu(I)/Ag(I) efflux system membrane fusion protein